MVAVDTSLARTCAAVAPDAVALVDATDVLFQGDPFERMSGDDAVAVDVQPEL